MSEVTKAVAAFTEGYYCSVGASPGCRECFDDSGLDSPVEFVRGVESGTVDGRTEFSSRECGCCGETLAGSRYTVHLRTTDDTAAPVFEHCDDICSDCYAELTGIE